MPDLQYLTTATADEPHLQFSWYLNTSHSFVLWPSLLPSPSAQRPTSRLTPGVPSLWSVILYPYGLQTITLEANSPLFPSSAVLNLILNKKRFRFLNEKKMSWTLSYFFFFFTLIPSHVVNTMAQCRSGMNGKVLLLPYFTKYWSISALMCAFKTKNWSEHEGDTQMQRWCCFFLKL